MHFYNAIIRSAFVTGGTARYKGQGTSSNNCGILLCKCSLHYPTVMWRSHKVWCLKDLEDHNRMKFLSAPNFEDFQWFLAIRSIIFIIRRHSTSQV